MGQGSLLHTFFPRAMMTKKKPPLRAGKERVYQMFAILGRILFFAILFLTVLVVLLFVAYRHRSDPSAVKSYKTTNPRITGRTQVSAHRAGAGILPEETMLALMTCAGQKEYVVDGFEFDLHITKDDVLVLLHDDELDRTSDSELVFGRKHVTAREMTYGELRRLNMAAKFTTDAGEMPYANLHGDAVPDELRIVRLEDALDALEVAGDFSYIIEMKNGGEDGKHAVDLLYRILSERNLVSKVAFGTFHGEVSRHVDEVYPDLVRGSYPSEVLEFYLASLFDRKDYHPRFRCLQIPFGIPLESYGVNLGIARFINYAHAHNIAVQYWTVDREEDMDYLLSLHADCIMTNYPDRLYKKREALGL